MVQAIQARANAYARREEHRFFSNIHRELTEHRVLTKSLDSDLAAYDDHADDLPAADHETIAEGSGPVFEELRRLQRRIRHAHRRTDELSALIHSRFTAAKLRANRFYDHSDEKIAIYWGAFQRSRATEQPDARTPVLRRSDWLTTKENTKLLELWQGRTDAQAK